MSTTGQKRKLEDTDIPVDDDDAPPIKQPKLMNIDQTQPQPTPTDTSTKETKNDQIKAELEPPETKEEKTHNNNNHNNDEEILDQQTTEKIKSQLEYYFGDSNLPLDKHILEISNMEINAGYYPISGLLNFTMIKRMTNSVTNLIKIIESSAKLQLNAGKDGVRRHPTLGDPPTKQEIYQRTIFAQGFHPRTKLSELTAFWKKHAPAQENILSVRTIKDTFSVGMGENNKAKMVKRFLGNCAVEFNSCELAAEFARMTFQHDGRVIRCGLYESYFCDEVEWKIKKMYYPFETGRVVFIRDIPVYSTYRDIKNWICNGLYASVKKKQSVNKVAYVSKEMNAGCAYARFAGESDMKTCVRLIKKKALMGIYPKIVVLDDEQARKVWKKVGEMKGVANKDVEIIIKKRDNDNKNRNRNRNVKEENDMDEDIDMEVKKETDVKEEVVVSSGKKHMLDDAESTQPIKKQKI